MPLLKLDTIQQVREFVRQARSAGETIGFVPTMGALHEGHLSLIRRARAECGRVVVSIFVNPTQFGPGEDFDRYPRPIERDLELCEAQGTDLAFCPPVSEMYGEESLTTVSVRGLTDHLCGPHRPGHFDGVTTVVMKLFGIVQPDRAYFGQKDAQQAVVIRRMVQDLFLPLEIVVCPTVREADGLAKSSRNVYLSAGARRQAGSLYAALNWARQQIEAGQREAAVLLTGMRAQIEAAGPCRIDYIELVDAASLKPQARVTGSCLIALAVRIENTRLIDNLLVDVPTQRR